MENVFLFVLKDGRDTNRILGIDYGDFTIGLAIFDCERDFIYPYKTIWREKANVLRKSIREIADIIKNENIDKVVVGLPLNYDGSSGDRVEKVKNFVHMLENKINLDTHRVSNMDDIKIHLQDERLTTKEAESILTKRNIKKTDQKKFLDQVAAEIILQDWREIWLKAKK